MATSRPVRIPRSGTPPPAVGTSIGSTDREAPGGKEGGTTPERRANVGGSQRVVRVAALYVAVLAALYTAFVLYDRTAPGGTAPPETNGLLLFTALFVAFALVGALYTLTPAPRALEVGADRVTVVGRWGRRRSLPPLDLLSLRVVRRYPAGWLADTPVELVELWGADLPLRSYLVSADLFAGAATTVFGR